MARCWAKDKRIVICNDLLTKQQPSWCSTSISNFIAPFCENCLSSSRLACHGFIKHNCKFNWTLLPSITFRRLQASKDTSLNHFISIEGIVVFLWAAENSFVFKDDTADLFISDKHVLGDADADLIVVSTTHLAEEDSRFDRRNLSYLRSWLQIFYLMKYICASSSCVINQSSNVSLMLCKFLYLNWQDVFD